MLLIVANKYVAKYTEISEIILMEIPFTICISKRLMCIWAGI